MPNHPLTVMYRPATVPEPHPGACRRRQQLQAEAEPPGEEADEEAGQTAPYAEQR